MHTHQYAIAGTKHCQQQQSSSEARLYQQALETGMLY